MWIGKSSQTESGGASYVMCHYSQIWICKNGCAVMLRDRCGAVVLRQLWKTRTQALAMIVVLDYCIWCVALSWHHPWADLRVALCMSWHILSNLQHAAWKELIAWGRRCRKWANSTRVAATRTQDVDIMRYVWTVLTLLELPNVAAYSWHVCA